MNRFFDHPFTHLILGRLIVLTGALIRLKVYLEERSLFLDEANLSRNIAERDWVGLLNTLDYQQYAPPGYLYLVKSATLLLGSGEYGLRLIALLSSLGLLVLTVAISRQLIRHSWPRLLPLTLIAFSYDLIRYGTENKQYAFDAMITALLVWLALRYPLAGLSGRRLVGWTLVGATAVWCSMPAVFVLTGVGLYYGAGLWQAGERQKLWGLTGAIACWLFSFGLYYWRLLRPDIGSDYLNDHHQAYFLPFLPKNPADWRQLGDLLLLLLRGSTGHTVAAYGVGGAALLWGMRVQARRYLPSLLLLLLPVLTCLLASGLKQYSLMPRLTLFLVPLLVLLMGVATDDLWTRRSWSPLLLLALWLPVLSLSKGFRHVFVPLEIENSREALQAAQSADSGSLVYVHHAAVPAAVYYRDHHPQRADFRQKPYFLARWDEPPDILRGRTPGDFWVVYSHLISDSARDEWRRQITKLQTWAVIVETIETTGALATRWRTR